MNDIINDNDIVHSNMQIGLISKITITINTNLQAGRQVPSDGEAGGKRRRSGERRLALRTGIFSGITHRY